MPELGEHPRFEEAIRAWRRAERSDEPIEKIVAMWESVEFYAAATPVAAIAGARDVDLVRAAINTLDLRQHTKSRFLELAGQANNAPLLRRFRQALAGDGVPHTESEIATLVGCAASAMTSSMAAGALTRTHTTWKSLSVS